MDVLRAEIGHRPGIRLEGENAIPWEAASLMFDMANHHRKIKVVVLMDGVTFDCYKIDCNMLDARGSGQRMEEVTGLHPDVLATTLANPYTATTLLYATAVIEKKNFDCIGFKCRGGVRRSVGAALALLKFVYPYGSLHPFNQRVQVDAYSRLLPLLPEGGDAN